MTAPATLSSKNGSFGRNLDEEQLEGLEQCPGRLAGHHHGERRRHRQAAPAPGKDREQPGNGSGDQKRNGGGIRLEMSSPALQSFIHRRNWI